MKRHAIKIRYLAYASLTFAPAGVLADLTGCVGDNCLARPKDLPIIRDVGPARGAQVVIDTIIFAAGAAAVAFMVIGGIRYITSEGDPGKTASAKSTIMYAIIGLIIAILSRVIVGFVINNSPK